MDWRCPICGAELAGPDELKPHLEGSVECAYRLAYEASLWCPLCGAEARGLAGLLPHYLRCMADLAERAARFIQPAADGLARALRLAEELRSRGQLEQGG